MKTQSCAVRIMHVHAHRPETQHWANIGLKQQHNAGNNGVKARKHKAVHQNHLDVIVLDWMQNMSVHIQEKKRSIPKDDCSCFTECDEWLRQDEASRHSPSFCQPETFLLRVKPAQNNRHVSSPDRANCFCWKYPGVFLCWISHLCSLFIKEKQNTYTQRPGCERQEVWFVRMLRLTAKKNPFPAV